MRGTARRERAEKIPDLSLKNDRDRKTGGADEPALIEAPAPGRTDAPAAERDRHPKAADTQALVLRGVLIAAMAALVLAIGHAAYDVVQGGGGFLIGGRERQRQRVPVARDIPLPEELEPLGAMASEGGGRRTIHRFASSQTPSQLSGALRDRMTQAGWECRRSVSPAPGGVLFACSNAAGDYCTILVSPDDRGGSVVNIVRVPRAPVSK